VNGPKGGLDKRCCVEATIAGVGPVIIDETDQDTYAAMDAAGERLGKLVGRVVDHRRSRRHRGREIIRDGKLLH
jgi:ribosome-associated translation inhibitor RaiA